MQKSKLHGVYIGAGGLVDVCNSDEFSQVVTSPRAMLHEVGSHRFRERPV